MGKQEFVGLLNYKNLLKNEDFIHSCVVTFKFSAVVIVGQFILGFALANLFKNKRPLAALGRTSIMLPWVVPPIALGLMWKWILRSGKLGLLNALFISLGIAPKEWLSYNSALGTLIMVTIWIGVPFTFLFEMAGLQKIPVELYEAAATDGANWFQKLRYVTLPEMKSTFLINIIMNTIGTIGYFDIIFALTGGGPNNATEVMPLYMYHTAFKSHQLGIGAAMAVSMLIICLVLTIVYLIVFRGGKDE
jgi:multiple sugar transport system permease protein